VRQRGIELPFVRLYGLFEDFMYCLVSLLMVLPVSHLNHACICAMDVQ